MKIIPVEILMSEQLTWQATAFVLVGLLNGAALAAYLMAKAVKAWKELFQV